MIALKRLASSAPDFAARLAELLSFEAAQDPKIDAAVAAILADVKQRGDAALLEYTQRFDRVEVASAKQLEIPRDELQRALGALPAQQRAALEAAARAARDGAYAPYSHFTVGAALLFGDGALTACKPISDRDLADFLAGCINDPSRHNRVLPIGGPGPALTPRQQGEQLFELLFARFEALLVDPQFGRDLAT